MILFHPKSPCRECDNCEGIKKKDGTEKTEYVKCSVYGEAPLATVKKGKQCKQQKA